MPPPQTPPLTYDHPVICTVSFTLAYLNTEVDLRQGRYASGLEVSTPLRLISIQILPEEHTEDDIGGERHAPITTVQSPGCLVITRSPSEEHTEEDLRRKRHESIPDALQRGCLILPEEHIGGEISRERHPST